MARTVARRAYRTLRTERKVAGRGEARQSRVARSGGPDLGSIVPISVVSQGPWRVASLRWQPEPGAFALTVTCCTSFNLAPGESPLLSAATELPLFEGDDRGLVEPWGPIAPWKHRAEVIVVGHAHAPEGA